MNGACGSQTCSSRPPVAMTKLFSTLSRLREESGEHPELEELTLCMLLAAAQSCAIFATGVG